MKLQNEYLRFAAKVIIATFIFESAAFADPPTPPGLTQLGAPLANAGNLFQGMNSAIPPSMSQIGTGTNNQDQGKQMQNMAQMAMGAMQILSGLLGLLAAAGMGDKGNQNNQDASGMSGLGPDPLATGAATSPTGSSTNAGNTTGTSNTGDTASSIQTVGIDAAGLRSGQVGSAMDRLEQNYGLPRDQVMAALQNGVDPKSILASAPKNAPSMDMLNKIADGLANQNGQLATRSLASNEANPGGSSAAGTPTGDKSVDAAKGVKAPTTPNADDAVDDGNGVSTLSPEIRAALAAKAAQEKAAAEMADVHNWNLFQLVHNRYKKLETMLYGRVERTNPVATDGAKPN